MRIGTFVRALTANSLSGPLKKMAAMALANNLMRLYFKINTLSNCKAAIKSLTINQVQAIDRIPKAHRVTFKFYTGRLAIFDDRLVSALCQIQRPP